MSPDEFWRLTPTEFWWLAEAHAEKRKAASKKPGQLDEDETMEMYDELQRVIAKEKAQREREESAEV